MKHRTPLLRWIAGMLALAAVLSLAACKKPADPESSADSTEITRTVTDPGLPETDSAAVVTELPSTAPITEAPTAPETQAPTEAPGPEPINAEALRNALLLTLEGREEEWQVTVIDPLDETNVSVSLNCDTDEWMTANYMYPMFLMAAAYQRVEDGDLTEDQIARDAKIMIIRSDKASGGRLIDLIGEDNPKRGRERVKAYIQSIGLDLGFNPSETRPDNTRSFVQARYAAELLSKIVRGEVVSPEASAKMLDILLTNRSRTSEIDFGLDGEIRYGFVCDVEDDVCVCAMGVVRLPGRSFVISAVCNKPRQMVACKRLVSELVAVTFPFFAD